MKTSVIDVHDMLSVLSVDEVEQRIRKVPGVGSATVNYAAGSATVRYDETRLEIADIKSPRDDPRINLQASACSSLVRRSRRSGRGGHHPHDGHFRTGQGAGLVRGQAGERTPARLAQDGPNELRSALTISRVQDGALGTALASCT